MDGQVLMHTEELITQNYSSSHKAIDLVGEGYSIDDVVAVSDGVVEIAVNTVSTNNQKARGTASYGNYVKIRHDDGTKSLYAHMQYGSVSVKTGDHVSKGQKIGRMGKTGNAHGIHLHFEIRASDETRINPIVYFKQKEETIKEEAKEETKEVEKVETKEEVLEVKDNVSANPENNQNISVNPEVNTPVNSENNKSVKPESNITNNTSNQSNDSSVESSSNNRSAEITTNSNSEFLSNPSYKHGSIVDGLKGIGVDSSYDYREELAKVNGINDYHGTYNQNVYLLSLLKSGKLQKA